MFVLSFFIIAWLGLWIKAFFAAGAVRHLQDRGDRGLQAARGDSTSKIAFCHQVREEAKKAKVQKFAQALVEKDAASKSRRWINPIGMPVSGPLDLTPIHNSVGAWCQTRRV